MSEVKFMRLAKAAMVYNVSIGHIVAALRDANMAVENMPTFKLTSDMIEVLENKFSADKAIKIQSDKIRAIQNAYPINSEIELEVNNVVPPGFIFFKVSDEIEGSLHISELNWNFGLCQLDFRDIRPGSLMKVCVIGFDNGYTKLHLSKKRLPSVERPSQSESWKNLILKKEVSATVFEEFRNKVIIQLDSGLFATIPLLADKSYTSGAALKVIPVRKISDHDIIECTLPEISVPDEKQSSSIIEAFKKQSTDNDFAASELCLNSYEQLSESLYWNYFSKDEQDLLKILFERTKSLFSKVEKGIEPIHIEFDFGSNSFNNFTRSIGPAIFDVAKLPPNYKDKDLLLELSKFNFWYTQFEINRKAEGTDQNISEKTFTLFNETVSIRGVVSEEGAIKIRNIKAKAKSEPESLREKQTALKRNDVFYINRPLVFSQYAPANTFNKTFIELIDNKLRAFGLFEIAKTKSLDILEKQGKEFRIFSNFLESQIDFEVKSSNATELQLKDCRLELSIQTDGITFAGKATGEYEMQLEDKVAISNRTEDGRPQSIGSGSILSITNGEIIIKSNVENFDLVQPSCFIKRISGTRQYRVQLDILNMFFSNKLPLDTFYKVFHDKDGIEPPEMRDMEFYNPIFAEKENPQTQAVRKAVGNKNILLIQGPPGTGKTTVITEIVKQLIKKGEKVLVTSQTHIAVDNVLERIKDDARVNIARIGHQDTISDFAAEYLIEEARKKFSSKVQKIVDVKIELLNYHNQGRDISEFSRLSFELPLTFDWENIQDFISLIQGSDLKQTTLMVETLVQWKEVIAKSPKLLTAMFFRHINVLFGTCIGIAMNKELSASEVVFDTVILDEAGKANISETLTAISRAKKIILVGDHKQLPPYLDSERVDYFKKFSKDFAEQKLNDDEIKHALGGSFFEYLQKEGVLSKENKILLSEQHRMHPDIANFVSQSFYNSELQNGTHTNGNIIPIPEPFDKQIIFIDTSSDGSSSETFKDGSYFSLVEAEFIVNKIIPELERQNISPASYAIISPYSKQCEKIRSLLSKKDSRSLNSIEVATLDSFQGREHDIIIFSFTRSAYNKKVGFLDDARRLNVAFSRAKKKLILIGNAKTLTNENSHNDRYYTDLFNNLWTYAGRYGKTYKINELNFRRLEKNHQPGEIIRVIVKRFEPYGVIVHFGHKHGLIPITQVSWDSLKKPTDILVIDQEIDAKIIRINDKGISLTLKGTTEKPAQIKNPKQTPLTNKKKESKMDLFTKEFKIHDVVDVKIVKVEAINSSFQKASVEMKFGIKGSFFTPPGNELIKVGNKVRVVISKIDLESQSIKCLLKA